MPVQFQDLIVLRTTSKTAPWARFACKSAARQRGAATVLMALLVGLAVMASTYAVVQYVRTSQDQSLTVHAQTQAQMNAWTAAEPCRPEHRRSVQLAGRSASIRGWHIPEFSQRV
jgi:predicted kinase